MSTLRVTTIQNVAGTLTRGSIWAWANFNGTGTVAVRESLNVSSVTDNGAGDYTVNFTTALPSANYAALLSSLSQTTGDGRVIANLNGTLGTGATTKTTTACRLLPSSNSVSGAMGDSADISFVAIGT
jgi:hypothetical protein